MDVRIERFVKNVGNKQHVVKLLNQQKLDVAIETEKDHYEIVIDNGSISLTPGKAGGSSFVKIQGNLDGIHSLLDGRVKLREGATNELFRVSGSFRNQLMLESLFFLAGKSSY